MPWKRDWIPADYRTTYQYLRLAKRSGRAGLSFTVCRSCVACRRFAFRCVRRTPTCDWIRRSLVDRCYANGRYDDLDYRAEPNPPLEADEAAWADELLRGKGLR